MDAGTRELLEFLESAVGAGGVELEPVLAQLAGKAVDFDPEELNAALRRALLLLATGGDPRRAIQPDGRAVLALAADLAAPDRTAVLAEGLEALAAEAAGLARVNGALLALRGDAELAWRAYAGALLADELAGE